MSVATYTKTGSKATVAAKLPKEVFAVEVPNHELLKSAYVAYLANGHGSTATTLKRGEVSGGGKKPWKQKGTGRARFGSSRNPIWRGGGIVFGPSGNENYSHKLNLSAKRTAVKQALTVSNDKIAIIEKLEFAQPKTAVAIELLAKMGATGNVLVVVNTKSKETMLTLRNIPKVKLVQATYLNVFDVLNADTVLIEADAVQMIAEWLNGGKK